MVDGNLLFSIQLVISSKLPYRQIQNNAWLSNCTPRDPEEVTHKINHHSPRKLSSHSILETTHIWKTNERDAVLTSYYHSSSPAPWWSQRQMQGTGRSAPGPKGAWKLKPCQEWVRWRLTAGSALVPKFLSSNIVFIFSIRPFWIHCVWPSSDQRV